MFDNLHQAGYGVSLKKSVLIKIYILMVHIFLCMLSKELDLTTEKAFDTKSDRFVSVDQTSFYNGAAAGGTAYTLTLCCFDILLKMRLRYQSTARSSPKTDSSA